MSDASNDLSSKRFCKCLFRETIFKDCMITFVLACVCNWVCVATHFCSLCMQRIS